MAEVPEDHEIKNINTKKAKKKTLPQSKLIVFAAAGIIILIASISILSNDESTTEEQSETTPTSPVGGELDITTIRESDYDTRVIESTARPLDYACYRFDVNCADLSESQEAYYLREWNAPISYRASTGERTIPCPL